MNTELAPLIAAAISIAIVHTVLGPDHYLPFIAMAHARDWSRMRTQLVTILCGAGHVLSSVVLGLIGVAVGTALTKLEWIESVRGDIAAWALTFFGVLYLAWGIHRALRHHAHSHDHETGDKANITPWILFTVFVLGPCEPLIPILMYPAAQKSYGAMILVAVVFSVVTISTMMAVVWVLQSGIRLVPLARLHKWSHALAGFAIAMCGVAIQLGL